MAQRTQERARLSKHLAKLREYDKTLETLNTQTSDLTVTTLEDVVNAPGVAPVINITNDSANLTSASLTATASGDVTFTTTGNASGIDVVGGDTVSLTSTGGSLSGAAVGSTSVTASGTSVNLDVVTPVIDVTATTGDATITGTNANLDVTGSAANGDFSVSNFPGNITINTIDAQNITLGTAGTGTVTGGTLTANDEILLTGTEIITDVVADTVRAFAVTGDVILTGTNPGGITVDGFATLGEFNYADDGGNVQTNGVIATDVDISSTAGTVTSVGATVLTGSTSVTVDGTAVNVRTNTGDLTATSTVGDITVVNTGANLDSATLTSAADIDVSSSTRIRGLDATGDVVEVSASGQVTGDVVATTSVIADGTSINLGLTTPMVTATATTGLINLTNNNPTSLDVTASTLGNVTLNNFVGADITTDDISGGIVTVNSFAGTVTSNAGTEISGSTVNVIGSVVDVNTAATNLFALSNTGDLTVDNTGNLDPAVLLSAGDVTFNNTGNVANLEANGAVVNASATGVLSGSATGTTGVIATSSAVTNFTSINLDLTTPMVTATATTGTVVLTGSNPTLDVTVTSGLRSVRVVNSGDITTNDISGDFIIVNSSNDGTVTSSAGTDISGQRVDVRGGVIDVNTATPDLVAVSRTGDLTVDNTGNLDPAVLRSAGDVTFNNTGNVDM